MSTTRPSTAPGSQVSGTTPADEKPPKVNLKSTSTPPRIVADIAAIGTDYLRKHPEHSLNPLHSNQTIARRLIAYNPPAAANNETYKQFLFEVYVDLPNFNGELATTIKNFLTERLQFSFSAMDMMEQAPLHALRKIGKDYLTENPEPTSWSLFNRHHNQVQATNLMNLSGKTSQEIWLNLLDVYGSLPDTGGQLAQRIELIVSHLLGITFKKSLKDETGSIEMSPGIIAKWVKGELETYMEIQKLPSLSNESKATTTPTF